MRRPSLRRRLLIAAAVWLVAAWVFGGFALSYAFTRAVHDRFDQKLETVLRLVGGAVAVDPDTGALRVRPTGEERFELPGSGWFWQIKDPAGTVLRAPSLGGAVLAQSLDLEEGTTRIAEEMSPDGRTQRAAETRIAVPGYPRPVFLKLALDDGEIRAEIASFRMLLAAALALLGAGLMVAVALQVGYGLRPLNRLQRDLQRIENGRLERLPDDYPAELAGLVSSFNAVMAHNQDVVEQARNSGADLAHALKTELAILQAKAGDTLRSNGGEMAAQVTRMKDLIEHRLGRGAMAGSGRKLGMHADAVAVIEEIAAALRRLHGHRRIAIEGYANGPVSFAGERHDLEEMLGNLAENACKHAASTVRITARRQADRLCVDVEDDGPGLDEKAARLALERGQRLDENSSGSGLGLAIVRDLAELYGGELTLGRAATGGLAARLDLPAAADQEKAAAS